MKKIVATIRRSILLVAMAFVTMTSDATTTNASIVSVGYSNGQVSETSPYKISGKGHVSAAVYITPEVYEKYAQCDFMGISVGLASAKYCDSLTVWVRETLDGENIVTKTLKRSGGDTIDKGWNNILFDTPLLLDGKSFFIGYTYHQSYKDGAVSVVGEPRPNTSFLKRGNSASWEDISSGGVVSLELLVGSNKPPYDLKIVSASATRNAKGVFTVVTNILNNGTKNVSEYDLTFSAEVYSYVQTVSTPIVSGATTQVSTILYDVPEDVGFSHPLTVTVSSIAEGEDDMPEDNSALASIRLPRNVVVEEYTGTGCGWCPRGHVGMDKLHERYGERYVGIAIHNYNNSDPMYPTRYKDLGFEGAPQCKIDRSYLTDPYYGKGNDICEDFEAEMEQPTFISVDASASFNDDRTAVNITANVKCLEDLNGASIGFVLTADSLTGTERAWKQSNYYYQYQPSQEPDDLKQFCNGGVNGGTSFFWIYNDVAIGSYYEGGNYEMPLGNIGGLETKTVSATVPMPTKAVLLEAIRYDLVTANVFVVDGNGVVANAAKVRVVDFLPNHQTDSFITFTDPTVKSICVTNWDTNGDGELSIDEAAAVTSLGTAFKQSQISSFKELSYFTGLTTIGQGAFSKSKVRELTIPENVTKLEKDAFLDCKSLVALNIPAEVTSIGQNALSGCTSMTSITVDGSNTAFCDIDGVLFTKDKKTLYQFPAAKATIYTVPEGTEVLGRDAFYVSKLESVELPTSLREMDYDAFGYSTKLLEANLPDGLSKIGDYSFDGCSAMVTLKIPSSVRAIGGGICRSCNAITDVYCDIEEPFGINDNNFTSTVYANATLHVPVGTKEKYSSLGGWKNFNVIESEDSLIESYLAISQDGKVATFYHDNLKGERSGMVFDLDDFKGLGADTAAVVTKVVFDPSFAQARPTSTNLWFYKMSKLTAIEGIEYLNTSEVTNMQAMFSSCSSLKSLDLSHFETSKVTTMRNMFNDCSNLTSLDVSGFNTSSVTTMYRMFNGCSKLTSLDVSSFNTTNVTDMYRMFYGCSKLASLDLSEFNIANVTTMYYMFYKCSSLTSLDISNFDTSNVTNMEHTFSYCTSLTSLDVSSFNTSKVTTMEGMFNSCNALETVDVSGFNTSNVKSMRYMFNGCTGLKSLDLSHFETSKTTNTATMLDNCHSLVHLVISGTMYNLNATACNGVGTEEVPCLITAPENFDFGVETTNSFQWKGGWFTLGNNSSCILAVETVSISAGKTADFPIGLTIDHEELYNGFQFDITLPEGFTLSKNGNKYAYTLADRYTNDMQVSFNELGENKWRVMVYSLTNALVTGLEGEAISLSIVADKNVPDEDQSGLISNFRLSRVDGKSVPSPDVTFNIHKLSSLYCEVETLHIGQTSDLSVFLSIDSEEQYNGYQFDITLPEGVTLAKNGTAYTYTLANRYTDNMQVSFNELGENQWRVMVYSLNNAMLTGLDGEIITLSIEANGEIVEGNYTGSVSTFRLSRIDGKSISFPDAEFSIQVDNNSCLIGDVNDDGAINISDVVCIVSWIMGEVPPVFIREAADYNYDGMITITDVTALVNYILNGSSSINIHQYIDIKRIETNFMH